MAAGSEVLALYRAILKAAKQFPSIKVGGQHGWRPAWAGAAEHAQQLAAGAGLASVRGPTQAAHEW